MALTKSYYSIDEVIIGEAGGGTRTGYLPDALGSVTATVDETGTITNTYRYKPYGGQLSKTGVGADPKFQWIGQWGYRRNTQTLNYVRARDYDVSLSSWISADPYWPRESPYLYASSNPVRWVDSSGFSCDPCLLCKEGLLDPCSWIEDNNTIGWGTLAFVVCCGDIRKICIRKKGFVEFYGDPGKDWDRIETCMKAHEQTHYDDVNAICRNGNIVVPCGAVGPPIGESSELGECLGYSAALTCLQSLKPPVKCTYPPTSPFCEWVEHNCTAARDQCKKAKHPIDPALDAWCNSQGYRK